jgi:hypothetical protein
MIPPARVNAPRRGRSPRRIRASGERLRAGIRTANAKNAPRYNNPAKSWGPTESNSPFEIGVLTPNDTAAPKPSNVPTVAGRFAINETR